MPALQYFEVPLGGGINTRDSIENLGTDFATLQYWDNERAGSLTSRNAVGRRFLTSGANPTNMWSVRNTAGTTAWLVFYASDLGVVRVSSNLTSSTLLLTWTTAQKWMGADALNGKLWMVNGADTPQSWDMTNDTTVLATIPAMPVARHIKMYKNYCFVAGTTANPSRVFFSTLKDPTSWPTNNFQDVAPDDGDQVTGLFATTEGLMVFKQTSVWMMLGDTFDATNPQWRLVKLNGPPGVGGLGYSTAAILPGVGVLWLAKDGVYRWNGQSIESVSEKIRPTIELFNAYSAGFAATVNGLTYGNRREAQGVVFRNRYWLSIEQGSATANTRAVLTMDINGNWQLDTESDLISFVSHSDTTYTNRLYAALNVGREIQEYFVNRSTSLATINFNAGDARTGFLSLGDPTRLKHLRRCFCLYSLDNGFGTMTITVTITPDGDTTRNVTLTFTAANGTAMSANLGDVIHLTETMYRRDVEINLQARRLQLRLQSSVATQTDTRNLASLHQLIFEYSTEPIHGGALV